MTCSNCDQDCEGHGNWRYYEGSVYCDSCYETADERGDFDTDRTRESTGGQRISSAATCVRQVPAILRRINQVLDRPEAFWAYNNDVLDVGGGKYDLLTEALAEIGARNYVLDPYNRSEEHNQRVVRLLSVRGADVAICSNVLNVIREVGARRDVHQTIKRLTKPDGMVFFTVYEGDRSSRGRRTSRGWQANRPTRNYIRELRHDYRSVELRRNKLIVCEGFK